MTHPQFHRKLEAAGFGIFVPFFFVTSGIKFDLHTLFASGSTIARVPVFLAALLIVRATSLGFFVVAGQIGMDLGLITRGTGAALIAAGLLSVLLFPAAALALLPLEADAQVAPSPSRSASQAA